MRLTNIVVGLLLLALTGHVAAAMRTTMVEYDVDGTKVQSVLVYDDAGAKRPGLVMVPNWMGISEVQIEKARKIAGSNYVVLLADVFGKDVRPTNPEHAGKTVTALYKDRKVLRARVNAALAQLKAQASNAPLDGKHFAAIGYCFGGATVLELARSGADVAAVVSFHGNLSTDDTTQAKNIKGQVLALNGADDPHVPAQQIAAFESEMREAKVDWQLVNFGGTQHCFSEINENGQVPGCFYNERADKRSRALMQSFLAEAFAR